MHCVLNYKSDYSSVCVNWLSSRHSLPHLLPTIKGMTGHPTRREARYSLCTCPFSFFSLNFQTLPIYSNISPHGGKTKWPTIAISFQYLCVAILPSGFSQMNFLDEEQAAVFHVPSWAVLMTSAQLPPILK